MSNITNLEKLSKIRSLYSIAKNNLVVTEQARDFSKKFQQKGIGLMDSLHLALCEVHGQDVLLTTDDQFVRKTEKLNLSTRVLNPVQFIMEAQNDQQ